MVPTVKLCNGYDLPVLGLGTFNASLDKTERAVKDAIDIGYRHFDCAYRYGNEKEIGSGIRVKISEGVITREDVFVTSKEGRELKPRDATGRAIPSDVDYVDTWRAMEECVKLGLARSIGLSNFNSKQIQRIMDIATIKPAVHQIECHPYLTQEQLIAFSKVRGMAVTAHCPLGSPGSNAKPDTPPLLKDMRLQPLTAKYNKTAAQVVLRYLTQHGVIPIPKSENKQHLEENYNIFDFELTEDEMHYISTFNRNIRICTFIEARDHKDYPFHIEF
ncbi:aldo-keto reductase family 1 member B1-like isoform X2 [Periplaneta americana]|uniref:aldo-keto reductase family 1 member B1-like isoform X2 n=1 Tax=Periplaneta americana TaxID=6978 RepID=UPI0037E72644